MRKEGQVEKPVQSKVNRIKESRMGKIMFCGKPQTSGAKKLFVKVCYFQELSEDAKVLVDAYGENPPVKNALLQNFISLR